MLSKSDEDILEERLKNWGRWASDKPIFQCNLIYRMMVQQGTIVLEPSELPKLDIEDALLVQRSWSELPQKPRRYWAGKEIIAYHYCYPLISMWTVCKFLRVRERDYEELLKTAKYMLFNRLNQHAAKRLCAIPGEKL